ncbi:hypothetical protein BT63DRAFT_420180 [Microthyrium microscopicum]|uniref:Pal1-domain-containing protein n=1 Tax=Microthyrium microscopicum TaxID=703497 RepID=A0A6A6UU18_9PEZI|nr:hypothetical protein BT63DRAFT_420180 [Microthyrium microscopicum]
MATTNMSSAQAKSYIVDPLLAPEPADETGLNSHFRSTLAPAPPPSSTASDTTKVPSPRNSTHARVPSNPSNLSPAGYQSGTRSRGNSLTQRYPGDMSHRPLDMIKKDNKTANRSPHLRKRSIPGVDQIDVLDTTPGGQYHHEGPFDATLASRNVNQKYSPVAAVQESNMAALKATPPENIADAVRQHRPLDGVAVVPPGMSDRYGRTYNYKETNLMTEGKGGDYNQMVGVGEYDGKKKSLDIEHREDSEPGYHPMAGQGTAIELEDQAPKKSVEYHESELEGHEEGSKRHSFGDGLKKRFGSLRRKKD